MCDSFVVDIRPKLAEQHEFPKNRRIDALIDAIASISASRSADFLEIGVFFGLLGRFLRACKCSANIVNSVDTNLWNRNQRTKGVRGTELRVARGSSLAAARPNVDFRSSQADCFHLGYWVDSFTGIQLENSAHHQGSGLQTHSWPPFCEFGPRARKFSIRCTIFGRP